MTAITTAADIVDLIESDDNDQRRLARIFAVDESGDEIGETPEGSVVLFVKRHEARMAQLGSLIAHVIERWGEAQTRMDAFEARMDKFSEELSVAIGEFKRLGDISAAYSGVIMENNLKRRFGMAMLDGLDANDCKIVGGELSSGRFGDYHAVAYDVEFAGASGRGFITNEERHDLGLADVVGVGVIRESPDTVWFVGEASATIGVNDVKRARRRAYILAKMKRGFRVLPFVYGGAGATAAESGVKITFQRDKRDQDRLNGICIGCPRHWHGRLTFSPRRYSRANKEKAGIIIPRC